MKNYIACFCSCINFLTFTWNFNAKIYFQNDDIILYGGMNKTFLIKKLLNSFRANVPFVIYPLKPSESYCDDTNA